MRRTEDADQKSSGTGIISVSYTHLQDDLTTKYGKKGGFETPEEAEKSYWEYEKRYQKKQRDLQIAKMQKTDVMLGDYLEYWFENIFSPRDVYKRQLWWSRI